ncbi:MAG: hypothetical protein EOO27_24295 [Comamonadaceae bacterium]|nr:MAG: hypothetical protein EOO27_24295 [Comamonadaceae bacterium]
MHQNNTVYKGYLLTARVERESEGADSGSPRFTASVMVAPADMIQRYGEPYSVPAFAKGDFAGSPRDAVHSAISHGFDIVDAIQGTFAGP